MDSKGVAPFFTGVAGRSGEAFLFTGDFFARVETTFFLFGFFGVGFFLDFLTAGRGGDGVGDGLVGVAGRGSCGDGVGNGLVGVSDGVPGSGAGNEGGLMEIFKEGGDVMATFSSATVTLGGDFIKQFPRFFGLPLLRF